MKKANSSQDHPNKMRGRACRILGLCSTFISEGRQIQISNDELQVERDSVTVTSSLARLYPEDERTSYTNVEATRDLWSGARNLVHGDQLNGALEAILADNGLTIISQRSRREMIMASNSLPWRGVRALAIDK